METAEEEKTGTAQAQADPLKKDPEVCKFFLKGRCHFGDRCRMLHSQSKVGDHKLVQTEENGRKNHKTRRKSGKTVKAKDEESNGPEKKLRMRTADDVISRILWDTSVDPADFIVGHLDRFLGVLERPFSEFSWDTQVCDCDYSEEMAIPRHRIQYFSYKGQRVWDKDSRTDHVFGSTGQSVMAPFNTGAEAQENVAPDTAEDREGLSAEDNEQGSVHSLMGAADQRTLSDDGETLDSSTNIRTDEDCEDAGLGQEAEGLSSTNIQTDEDCEDAGLAQEAEGLSSTNIQTDEDCEDAGLAQEAEGLSISPGDEQITTQDEWTDSWDKEDVKEEEAKPAQPIPQEPLPGRQRRKPTHFICFRVDSPAALRAFQLVQKKVLTHLPQSEPLWVKPESLHVTLSLLVLPSPADTFAASELLQSVVKNFYKPPISVSFTPRLRNFNGKVLYLAPQPLLDIQNLNAHFQNAFREKGWLHRDSRDPTYHLMLAKVTEVEADRIFEDVWQIKLAKDLNFGKLMVDKLYLCVNSAPCAANGFYETVCSVQFPTI